MIINDDNDDGGARGVVGRTLIVVGNGHITLSSYLKRECLYFSSN